MNLENKIIEPQAANFSFIKSAVTLADKNWFKTGGLARYFCEPTNAQEFQDALAFAKINSLEIFMLGEGANILISDEGFNGLVIRPRLNDIAIISQDNEHSHIYAGAGVSFESLINWCLDNNLTGLEEFSGIPGTVGGSVFINIHYFEFLLSNFLISAQVICKETNTILNVDNAWFNFGYNYSKLHEHKHYLVSAAFRLKRTDALTAAYNKGRSREIIRHRAARYPKSNTCGSFFRNFFEHEVNLISNGKKLIYVAYYLDKIGVKGTLTVGDAIVSYQHANMIVNRGNATTRDIIGVAKAMQEMVYKQFGILPQPECRLIGFKEYPFMTQP